MKAKAPTRLNLHDALDSGSFEHAIILTYTFDALFFEEYCLANLESLHNCKSISVCLDRSTYEKIIGGADSERPKEANLRYLLHPVSVPGVFHPKLVLLTSSTKGRLLIGSANFSRPGVTTNAELVASYEFKSKDREEFAPIFRSAFELIRAISDRWPTRHLTSNLQEMERDSPWLQGNKEHDQTFDLISNLDRPLLDQLLSKVKGPVSTVSLVSRYFDEKPYLIEQLFSKTNAKRIEIFTQNQCTNLPPSWLQHSLFKSGRLQIFLAEYSSDERNQPLHGKFIALQTSDQCLVAFGSANSTTPALLKSAKQANVEILVAVQLSKHEAKDVVPKLLDPEENAQRLTDPKKLVSVPIEKNEGHGVTFLIEIKEAEADKDQLLIWLAEPLSRSGLQAKLELSAGRLVRLPVVAGNSSELGMSIGEEVAKRLSQTSAILSFEDQNGTQLSNRILVTNLMDVQTGLSVRKARYVKEAEQNAAGLLSVLRDLRSGVDEDALRTFLTFCDIPLILESHLRWRPLAKGVGENREGMRSLGQQNFSVALTLHELALKFCDRHFRKLRRHEADRKPSGIGNFLHIALAIGGILESQIDRALSGLEARNRVTTEEWSTFRNICDTYFLNFRELNLLMWEGYLSKIIRESPEDRIREAFEPEIQPLDDLSKQMLDFRARVEKLRVSKCLMASGSMKGIPFGYFQSVFGAQRWASYEKEMKTFNALIASVATMGTQQQMLGQVGRMN